MATINQRFGDRIRLLREKRKMSQLALAQKARLDITTINELENGNRDPMLKTIWRLANALEVHMSQLFDF